MKGQTYTDSLSIMKHLLNGVANLPFDQFLQFLISAVEPDSWAQQL